MPGQIGPVDAVFGVGVVGAGDMAEDAALMGGGAGHDIVVVGIVTVVAVGGAGVLDGRAMWDRDLAKHVMVVMVVVVQVLLCHGGWLFVGALMPVPAVPAVPVRMPVPRRGCRDAAAKLSRMWWWAGRSTAEGRAGTLDEEISTSDSSALDNSNNDGSPGEVLAETESSETVESQPEQPEPETTTAIPTTKYIQNAATISTLDSSPERQVGATTQRARSQRVVHRVASRCPEETPQPWSMGSLFSLLWAVGTWKCGLATAALPGSDGNPASPRLSADRRTRQPTLPLSLRHNFFFFFSLNQDSPYSRV